MRDNIYDKEQLSKPVSYYASIRPTNYAREEAARAEKEAAKAARHGLRPPAAARHGMYHGDTEILFPMRVAPALRDLRGEVWARPGRAAPPPRPTPRWMPWPSA